MSIRSQSNRDALSLFYKGVRIEQHSVGIYTCIEQSLAFNNDTSLTDTLADMAESKEFSKKLTADIVGMVKALVMDCRASCSSLVKPTSKKDDVARSLYAEKINPLLGAYINAVAPLVNKQPTVKTEEQKAIDKAASEKKAGEKSASWAKENGWVSPEQIETVQVDVMQSAEVKHLQKLLDEARAETIAISEKLSASMVKLAALHGENAILRGNVETLSASNAALSDKLSRIKDLPKVSKSVLTIAA